jgi:uncharacterized protein YjbJ (UPF0337 family)
MNQIRGGFHHRLGRVTGSRRRRLNGRRLKLTGRIQTGFGRARARAGKRFRSLFGH